MHPRELGFQRRAPVRWFHPRELLRAGVRAGLASLFGAYVDRRELQAALHPLPAMQAQDYSDGDELWLDYVADVGDGFDATYAVASVLAQPRLELSTSGSAAVEPSPTCRGRVLVMGGDQVYPTATQEEYQHRTVGPYAAALPWSRDPERAPHLYAIPGNHDWYDGLAAFLRQFAQERWIGGWKTRQRRSYFALRLPHRYWLWGIDIQLHADVDGPQLDYFEHHAASLAPGDHVILCTAEPSWVQKAQGPDHVGFRNLQYVMQQAQRRGARVVLVLTGDSHHYCRYDEPKAHRLYLTAGGGGAFLHGTHTLPERIAIAGFNGDDPPHELTRGRTYPAERESELQILGIWRFPLANPQFALLWAAVWALLIVTLTSTASVDVFDFQSTWLATLSTSNPLSTGFSRSAAWVYAGAGTLVSWFAFRVLLGGRLANVMPKRGWLLLDFLPWFGSGVLLLLLLTAGAPSPLGLLGQTLARSPAGSSVIGLVLLGNVLFVNHPTRWVRWGLGVGHAVFQVLWWLLITVVVVGVSVPIGHDWPTFAPVLPVVWWLFGSLLAGLWSAVIFALFLWFAGRYLPGQLNDVSSALSVTDYKNFLRLHLSSDGQLTVYPVGLARVPSEWSINSDSALDAAWLSPAPDEPLHPTLIEGPLVFDPHEARWQQPSPPPSR